MIVLVVIVLVGAGVAIAVTQSDSGSSDTAEVTLNSPTTVGVTAPPGSSTPTVTTTATPSFPPVHTNPAGLSYVPVADQSQAAELCNAAQSDWPDEYSAYDQVTFDIPGTGSDVTCVRTH